MAKIGSLPFVDAADVDGTETLPVVKDGTTKRALLADLAQPTIAQAQLLRDQAADLLLPENRFIDQDLATVEAGLAEGTFFKLVDSAAGLAGVYRRDAAGSTKLYDEVTAAGLETDGAAKIGLAGGQGNLQRFFDGVDMLPGVVGNGIVDDSPRFAGPRSTIYVCPNETPFLASDVTILGKVVSLGGIISRAADARVRMTGGYSAPLDSQGFDLSNIVPSPRIALDHIGNNEWQLGTGAFEIAGRAYLRWFMSETVGDQSKALLALAETEAAEQWISTDCEFTLAHLGGNTIVDAFMLQVAADKSYRRDVADPMLNAFGGKVFGLLPRHGLDRCHVRRTPRGFIDMNARNSFDAQENLATLRAAPGVWQTACSAGGFLVGPSLTPVFVADVAGFQSGEPVSQEATGARGFINSIDAAADRLWVAVIEGHFDNASDIVGTKSGAAQTPTAAVPVLRHAPYNGTQIDDVRIIDVMRNAITANYARKLVVNGGEIEDCWADHPIYADANPDMQIRNPTIRGFANQGLVQMSSGTCEITVEGLKPHPLSGTVDTEILVQFRNDTGQTAKPIVHIKTDLVPLSPDPAKRRILYSSGGQSVQGDIHIEDTGPDDDAQWTLYDQSTDTSGVFLNVFGNDIPGQARVFLIANGGGTLDNFNIRGEWRIRPGAASHAGHLMVHEGGDVHRLRIRDFQTAPSSGIGPGGLLRVEGNVFGMIVDGLDALTFSHTQQLATIAGNYRGNVIRNSRFRSARPDAALTEKVHFEICFHDNLMNKATAVVPTGLLPPAGANQDGRIIVEDSGAATLNLIVYGDGVRHRFTGVPF